MADETAVAQILLDRWDPLGVADIDVDPKSEYLHEAARAISLLRNGIDRFGLIAHLTNERRGLSGRADVARDQIAADVLLDWWATVESA